MTRITALFGACVAMAAGAYFWLGTGQSLPPNPLIGMAEAQDAAEIDTSTITEMVMGNADAPVEIIEYASFTCPHCATFHNGAFKKLKADFIDTGKVRFIYREVYFDKFGLWASMMARCTGPDKFFGLIDLIFDGQSDWARADSQQGIVDALKKIGRLGGMSDETLNACMQDSDKARTLVTWYQENATADEITGTPSFIVNGKKVENQSYSAFKALIEAELNG